jgi:hypothetical protein
MSTQSEVRRVTAPDIRARKGGRPRSPQVEKNLSIDAAGMSIATSFATPISRQCIEALSGPRQSVR